jgi:sulfonate transport system substrate-binding protein
LDAVMSRIDLRLVGAVVLLALAPIVFAGAARSQDQPTSDVVRIGFQRSSTLTAILKANGELEKSLAPLGVRVTWHEFTSGLPLLEALNLDSIDFSADVADTVPIFAQAAGARVVYVAEEAPSPTAQAILVSANSPIQSLAELKGKTVAVTKGAGSHFLLLAALAKVGLSFKDIKPAYLTPGDGQAAFVSGNVDAWVAWDPFLTSAQRQSGARILSDGTGIANYKRYYLASERFAARRSDVLAVIFERLRLTGQWLKQHPQDAADLLAGIWGIDAGTIAQADAHRSYLVAAVTRAGLSEQQRIADAFATEGLIPGKVETGDIKIWQAPDR